jgi:ArsR family transcriptional regulator, arsenate/arsenite/antimonite-responsive transcriptional repressor
MTLMVFDVSQKLGMHIDICQYRRMSKSVLELTPVQAVACCSPVTREPLAADQAERIVPLLKARPASAI